MSGYRFVGSYAVFADDTGKTIELKRFGQSVELAKESVIFEQRVALVPAGAFEKEGFTDQELNDYSSSQVQRSAPAAFLEKKETILSYFRTALAAGSFPVEVESAPKAEGTEENA